MVQISHIGPNALFDVSGGVGKGRANNSLDVKLVQFMLFSARSPRWPSFQLAHDGLSADGVCGRITQSWIDAFQVYGMLAYNTVNDGAIDAFPEGTAGNFSFGTDGDGISHQYTMSALNTELANNDPLLYKTMGDNSRVPADLRQAILAAKAQDNASTDSNSP